VLYIYIYIYIYIYDISRLRVNYLNITATGLDFKTSYYPDATLAS